MIHETKEEIVPQQRKIKTISVSSESQEEDYFVEQPFYKINHSYCHLCNTFGPPGHGTLECPFKDIKCASCLVRGHATKICQQK